MKLHIREQTYLQEAIADIKKYYPNIDDDVFMQLINLDPTYRGNDSAGKYGKWLLNLYNKGNLSEEEFDEVTPLLNQFTTYRNRVQNKDLNSYKSLDALSDVLASVIDDDSMLTDRQKVRFLKNVKSGKVQTGKENDYDTVYEDSNWVVWVPNTHEASMKLGKGTDWCTAHENPEWYDQYTYEDGEEFSLYIMKNKDTGERFQYCDNPYRGYDYQFMDESDTEVDTMFFMSDLVESDNAFAEWLHDLNPEFFKFQRIVDGLIIEDDTVTGTTCPEADVVIPDDVEFIGESAFYQDDIINTVYISSGVKQIESLAFAKSSLSQINLDDAYSLEFIGQGAFRDCDALTGIISLPNIEVIYREAFTYSGISQMYIGNSLAIIGKYAFYGCDNLEYIEIEDTQNGLEIFTETFANCPKLKEIHLPKNIKRIEINAFNNCSDDLTIYTDSQWMRDNIEAFNINLCDYYGDEIYIKDKGFVD